MATVQRIAVGPLDIDIVADKPELMEVVQTSLAVYDLGWQLGPHKTVQLECQMTKTGLTSPAHGDYIEAARMLVDKTPEGLRATTDHGASAEGTFDDHGERWLVRVPVDVAERGLSWEIEDLLSLVLTIGWRRAGWVPLHAAGLTDGTRGVLVCAASGGGKTTFTLAMVRAGWRSLGDDKLLLRTDRPLPLIGALKHMLNVDPAVDGWFPEIGDLRGLPEYSAWTPKRRVRLSALWPDATAGSMHPTTIVGLERRPGTGGTLVEPMDASATLGTLLRQTVIPHDPGEARWITGSLAACARQATGVRVSLGDDAYADPEFASNVASHLQ